MESQVTLMRALVASVPVGMLFAGALALFLRGKALSSLLQLLGAGCLWSSFLLISARRFICFRRWSGDSNLALVITSISGVLFSGSHRFPSAICFTRSTERHQGLRTRPGGCVELPRFGGG